MGVVVLFELVHWLDLGHLGSDLIVVLDCGAERLARADQFRQQFPLQQPEQWLIRCPLSPLVPQPMLQLLQGYDTATQITVLADWLCRRQAHPPQRIWIATVLEQRARATLLARIALVGRGIPIQPDPPPLPSPGERRKLVRDALSMSLRRSTGSWLVPQAVARKQAQ